MSSAGATWFEASGGHPGTRVDLSGSCSFSLHGSLGGVVWQEELVEN